MAGILEGLEASNVSFLPIVSAYARELGVVEEINRLCNRRKGVDAGKVCLALILDTLTGRSPLFRLEDSFSHLDVELLLGEGISVSQLNDDAVGRVLDCLYEVGTNKVLSAVALRAVKLFDLDVSHVHHDTTSRSVYGDYELVTEGGEPASVSHHSRLQQRSSAGSQAVDPQLVVCGRWDSHIHQVRGRQRFGQGYQQEFDSEDDGTDEGTGTGKLRVCSGFRSSDQTEPSFDG